MSDQDVFKDWLKSVPVLLTGDTAGTYGTWLAESGALVCQVTTEARAREFMAHDAQNFLVAVLDAECATVPWLSIMIDLPASCGILVVSDSADPGMLRRLRSHGAQYLSKSATLADFMFAMSTAVSLTVPNMQRLAARAAEMWKLPRQQARLLYYNLWSYTDQEIADAMGLSRHTVQQYQEELRKRTGVKTKHSYLRRLLATAGAEPPLNMSDDTLVRLTEDRRHLLGG